MKMRLSKLFLVVFVMCIFSCVMVFGATVGDQLVTPEKGWQRIDDMDKNIQYIGNVGKEGLKGETSKYLDYCYNRTRSRFAWTPGEIYFKFYGTELRIIDWLWNFSSYKCSISVDGGQNWKTYSNYAAPGEDDISIQSKRILYEEKNLSRGIHSVIIKVDGTGEFCLDAIDIDEDGYMLPYGKLLNVEPQQNVVQLEGNVVTDVTIDNTEGIAAEDIYIKYDSEKLRYTGCEEVEGIKLVYNDEQNGTLRFILASKGESNIINDKKTLLNLNFKAIAPGEALVDITKGRITDGIEMEKDVEESLCGQATITIEEAIKDVNNSGEFTLLDLGIDARHFGKNPKAEELTMYNTDVAINDAIDDDDLLKIGQLMLANDNYAFNK